MSIKVIGAGFPRTGTSTLKKSLEILGFSKCYHMKELLVNPVNYQMWKELHETQSADWDQLYEGYQATVDFPCYPVYQAHMERYPDAKVILTVRPFEAWYESASKTVRRADPETPKEILTMLWKMVRSSRVRQAAKCVALFKQIFWEGQFQGKFADKAFAQQVYEQHIADVTAYVPADRLLIYDVREGWEPLCTFLGVPIPEESLPHLNKKENFKDMLGKLIDGQMVG